MYLGIDIGTSELKALLLDECGEIVGTAHAELTVQRPHPQQAEQNPLDWWQACGRVVSELRHQYPQQWAAIRAIGLSGQMHGAVLLDNEGNVLRPCILWNDSTISIKNGPYGPLWFSIQLTSDRDVQRFSLIHNAIHHAFS